MTESIKNMKIFRITIFFILLWMMVLSGCSERKQQTLLTPDSTIVFLSKQADDLSATITLFRKLSKRTGKPVDVGTVFTIGDKELVRAYINLENRLVKKDKMEMLHLDWISPAGKSIYLKRIDLTPSDTSSLIYSSISVNPETREPGIYALKVYYFRELIAEKKFELLPFNGNIDSGRNKINAEITFYKKADKKSGKRYDPDTVFTMKKNGWMHASVALVNRFDFDDDDMKFKFEWIGPDDSTFYRKLIVLSAGDSATTLNNSVSVSPETRKQGHYKLRVSLSGEMIAEKKFSLVSEPPPKVKLKPSLRGTIAFCTGTDKQTGERTGIDSVFKIREKGKVWAFVDLEKNVLEGNREMKFKLDWIGPDQKSFFQKQIVLTPNDSIPVIQSSISATPDKRQPGQYQLKVYLMKDIIAQGKFELAE